MNTTTSAPEVLRLANAAYPSSMVRGGDMLTVRVSHEEWPALQDAGFLTGMCTEARVRTRDIVRDRVRAAASWDAYSHGLSVVRIVDASAPDVTLDAFPVDPRPFLPAEGMRVEFPSKSASGGTRYGRVVWVKGAQTRVSYRFKHGGESEKTVPTRSVRPAPGASR